MEAGKENAFLSKDLATIFCEVPIEFDFGDAKFSNPDFDKLKEILFELEFKTIYSKLLKFYQSESSAESSKANKVIEEANEVIKSYDDKNVKYHLITLRKRCERACCKTF